MTDRIVVATHNVKKGVEMATILQARFPSLQILTFADFPGAPEPDETGSTYEENAVIKAGSAVAHTGEWCVADDAGLEIDAIPGELGVFSKRFIGEDAPFTEKMRVVLERLDGLPDEQRGARFRCFVALAAPGRPTETFEGVCEGRIALAPSGSGGFGYDPIFWLPDHGCTMADLTPGQKHAVSHRGKVLRLLGDRLAELGVAG
ncbi:MAG: RdgB/HAM1 family non-canonical purine NTP pyrophosphatase [Armatimonadetes bacterium]|nr:RdgB/HAM1 family non-canonical purine NTP pyrophosphatase [Armatimonadota bacterium]